MKIKEWAAEDRPREKMLLKGISSLSDAELLAILIGSGNQDETAVQLSQRILHTVDNNLNALGKLSIKELKTRFKGVGTVKAITIVAALELGRRRGNSEPLQRSVIRCSQDAFHLFHPLLCDLPHEELWVALLNKASKVTDRIKISQGGTGETSADLRIILKAAINSLASGMILCHNHPSGNSTPSQDDIETTQRLTAAGTHLGIQILDHIIITKKDYYSFREHNMIPETK